MSQVAIGVDLVFSADWLNIEIVANTILNGVHDINFRKATNYF
jgi:hypothetical protein